MTDKKIILERSQRLGELLATSNLPDPVIEAILTKAETFSLRQIDLLIDALGREQEQWQDLEKVIPEIEKIQKESQAQLEAEQEKIAQDFVEKAVQKEEKAEQELLKKKIQED